MGKALGAVGGIGGSITSNFTGNGIGGMMGGSALFGNNPLTKALGLSGEQGEFFHPTTENQGLDQLNAENQALTGTKYNEALRDMTNGKTSLADGMKDFTGAQREGMMTDGVIGSRLASQEVQNNPLTAGLYGKDGLQGQLSEEGNRLANQGFGLQQQDHEAYGQAAGDIARQFGQQEQATMSKLASRGLAGGSSGAAVAEFAGNEGRQNEMLAKAQTDIMQRRVNDTMQRLNANRQMQSQLGAQGAADQQAQYDRQLSGAKNRQQNVINAAQAQTGANAMANSANEASMKDKRGAKGKTLLEGLGQGMFSSAQQTGAAPGTFVSGVAGAGGSAMGSGMMASDERNKENVTDGAPEIQGFLDSLGTHKYDYKPHAKGLAGAGEGEHYSPMAQELEETPVGASMVQDTPDGKQVDYGKGFGALASGLGELNDRLKRLEGRA
jgi:hypothetical protein